ncbi:Cilia- and flagella-associated protein 47 [Acipenser ruthenus]|uniref:Cilia-and flagella-associated protein 47 n=1 Tax=Acipenser ruthenus TaxID=7906 RepID=A0A444U1X4_ACIRT|nr:Cilia- and flagella-associated protein 47 [Acipenser ruthenus]
MEDDVSGVRISPPFLKFLDVKAGKSYKAIVCVKNNGKTSKRIQIKGAVSKNFKLTVVNPDKPIAPGLQVFATVEYLPENDENFRDRLILLADEAIMEIPLLVFSSSCYLDIESEVDFGKVVANSTVLSKEIGIVNHGSAPGAFKIKYQGNLPITIVPTSGIVEPKTMQLIKVELCTDRSRTINEIAIVKLQDSVDATLNIKAEVVEQVLELLDTSNQKLECVRFGPAYFGTSKVEQGILYNNSPVPINWVAVLQDDAIGAEVGTDLEMTTDAALLEMGLRNRVKDDISELVSCLPSEGTLGPYEKAAVSLCFSPLYNSNVGEPAKQDYALFMKFEIVGSKNSFIQDQNNKNLLTKDKKQNCVELALTGTGLPVDLTINPGPRFSFKECNMGECVDILCELQNNSLLLPVVFGFRKTANFNMSPSKGKINPGQQQDVMLSFAPHQVGSFKVNQLIDVFGQEAVQDSCSVQLKASPFHQITLCFTGVCKTITKNIEPKFNPGITPSISNETGQFVEVKTYNLRKYSSSARMAVLSAAKTGIHTHKRSRSLDKNALVAFPNDRYASIRPTLRNEQYRTIFTKAERYNYVDPDFAYTEEEEKQIKAHKDYYFQFIQSLRKQRIQKEKERDLADVKDKVDIGIKPAAGLHPQRLSVSDIEVEQNEEKPLQRKSQLLTTRALAEIETRSTTRPVTDGLNVVPSTPEEKEDCNITLTAQQLHQVIIGPSAVNFGEVCVHSVSTRHLNIVNNLPVHIWMQIDIACQELQQTSPLSHVVPPMSRAFVALLFETNALGKFQKSITYSINKKHSGHVLVLGTVVPVALELCTQELVLTPTFSSLTESGFRSTVALRNPRNHPAEFTWKPIITERGIAFSIRPATGTVEAHKELECEVVWHPSFYAPEEGEFDLCVHQGNTARLKCTAKLGPTHVQFAEQHIVFGAVAVNFTTVKTAILRNTGQNHAYFQVFDVYPLPGMTVIPAEGVVPVGGYTELQILFSPNAAMKFDTRVEVAIRNTKTLELRIGGSVEVPQVDMSVVAAYDFCLPVRINNTRAPSPPPSSIPKTPSVSEKHIVTPRPQIVTVDTPSRRVQATAIKTSINDITKMFLLPVAATADNCILTAYPYLALHRSDQQIVLKSGQLNGANGKPQSTGEAILHPCYTPGTLSSSTSSSSTFIVTSSTCEESFSDTLEENLSGKGRNKTDETDPQGRKNTLGFPTFPAEDSEEGHFYHGILKAVQKWFSLYGWPKGSHPISVPQSLRSAVCKVQTSNSPHRKASYQVSHRKDTKTVYDMLFHLSGQMLPGITASQSLPCDLNERVLQLHWQHSTLLTFLKAQGSSLAYIRPEFLLAPEDFRHWIGLQAQLGQLQKDEAKGTDKPQDISLAGLDAISFESLSKRAWTDVLLQIYKVLVLSRVSTNNPSNLFVSENVEHIPKINPDPLSSNIYSTSERKLLTWLNFNYEKMRSIVWRDCSTQGDIPPGRWIINFDLDLLDGLVLAAVLAAYCPFLISTHFLNMYTNPTSLEQCLHNSLVLVNAFRAIGLDIDIQATDISDPNAVMLLMLCVYLYERLPQYLPRKTVDFVGSLHAVTVRQVRLKNSSSKPLVYYATIVGKESADFSLPKGNTVTVLPKGQTNVTVELASRFLHPVEAVLLLTSRATCGAIGATMAFSLRSQINHIIPSGTFKCKSPCYELKKFNLKITNAFNKDGEFRINLVESTNNLMKNAKQDSTKKQDIKSSHLKSVSDLSSRDHINEDRANNQDLDSAAKVNFLNEFFSPMESVVLEAGGSEALELHYLPFHLGKRYCTIILSNEQVGEFVYSVEGKAELPLPLSLLPVQSPHVLRVSSASPGHSREKPTLCFKCSNHCVLEEELKIPLVNEAMERALATVAQQRMSSLEFERRKITGTLESSSVRAAVSTRGMSRKEAQPLQTKLQNKPPYSEYTVEVTMPEHFEIPKTISLPVSVTSRVNLKTAWQANVTENDAVAVPLKFHPKAPGRYPCQIILHSPRDVRVYLIECVVNSEGTEAELEFVTPAHQSVTQDIPLNNQTLQDWKLRGIVKGNGFYGPPVIYVRAGERVQYPLMFRPVFECITLGKLTLQNETDGTEHIFGLKGVGKKPLALDHVVIDCQVRQITQKVLMVPNYTQTRLICKVVSDLPVVSGAPTLDIKAGHTASYPINISSWKRGKHTGVISFIAEDGEQQQTQCDSSGEETDDKQPLRRLSDEASHTLADSNQKVESVDPVQGETHLVLPEQMTSREVWDWLVDHQGDMKRELSVDTVGVEIPITNPTNESLHLDVLLIGPGLIGERSLVLRPKEKHSYLTKFSPTITGRKTGCVIFQSDVVGEFWYELELIAEKPVATTLPELQCELGKWTREFIPLVNPTDETLKLETVNSNPSNFSLEIEPKKPLEEWTFHMSGVGLIPLPMEPLSISTCVGTHSSIIVPFRNPTDDNVLVDVLLTDQEQTMHRLSTSILRQSISKESAFRLPLKQTQGILLTPKEKMDIPLVFTPDTMRLYESLVVVRIVKEDGGSWAYDGPEPDSKPGSIRRAGNNGSIKEIRWVYPIHGIPEAVLSRSSPAVIRCQARNRIEERIEVLLTGSVPGSSASPVVTAKPESLINKQQHRIQTEVHVTEGLATTEEFLYDIQFESDEDKAQLESSVALCLLSKERDTHTGIVTLIFNTIFAPYKPLRCSAFLAVRCATGGIWKFPIQLVSTEPEVDDVINIEAVGLNKVSMVGFRLTSQTRYVEPFTAYFLPGSGSEFEVSPQSGELLPIHSAGTLITVSFSPSMYSKKHRATLVIQTGDMQWMYDINGVQPQYIPPTSQSSRIVSSGVVRATAVQQRNFIRENLQLTTTSVSSPIKGCPLVLRTK